MRLHCRTPQTPLPPHASLRDRLLAARGADPSERDDLAMLLAPSSMKDIGVAALRIEETIAANGHIVIVADYDADGATACAIAVRGLRMFGASVSFVVPNRFTDGYGLSPALVDRALEHKPALIVTVDNGIAALAGIDAANAKGVPVVVTDHHLAGDALPKAAAIVNPNQPGCAFPSKNLAGCGVMFYVLIELRRRYREQSDARGNAPLNTLFDILALGTVADVVQLDRNNRVLITTGLARLHRGFACPGIRNLFRVSGRSMEAAGAIDLGFYIGPRINAAGRMDDASVGIRCLITDDEQEAASLAEALEQTNQLRKAVQADIQEEAEALAQGIAATDDFSIVVANPYWHEGVIGIVAGRLKERFRRPAIVFAAGEEGLLKGSCRSILALHMRDAIDAVDRRLPGCIVKFGGHAMAAGLTINAAMFDQFRQAFEDQVRASLKPADLEEVVEHDGPLSAEDLTVENADWIRRGVWGQGFPAPSFLMRARVRSTRILKDKHTKFALNIDGRPVDAILFNQVIEHAEDLTVHAKLEINEWNGRRSVQLMLERVISD
ncbi:single-stranded-DNA-specific exonuclease RecJ [Thauera sp. 27]|uniref:single-stranded-DNA-specific exonuclease RecJ n=1 Tax=Thauera sp. 27 TaxID=305700 RepID=UPI0022B605EB|nr:single-stranded-DNA-specific exonuclease RecJ [Thauera sp. 27]